MSTNTPDLAADPAIVALTPARANVRQFAAGLVIKSADAYEKAAAVLKSIKGALLQIEDARTRITKPLNDTLREVNAQAKAAAAPFLEDEAIIKAALVRYSDEQDRLRQEEQRRQNEIARKEQERLRAIAAEAERKAQAEAAAKRRAAEEAAAAGRAAEAAKLAAQAQRIEEKGTEKQVEFEGRAAMVTAPIATQAAPKVAGLTIPKVWDFEVTDPALVPREYLTVDETKIRRVVVALKDGAKIPGVRVFERKRIAAGAT